MTVKDVINEVIESETLKKYFTENIKALNRWQITDLIAGARIPMERKMEIAKELAKSEPPKEFDGDYTYGDLYQDAKFALDELKLKEGELFILVGWSYEDNAQRQFECAPFFSIDKAINYIKTEYAELDENDNVYFRLEKWIPDHNGDMTMTCDYIVSNKGNIWFCDHSGIPHLTFFNSRFHNVPVPFNVGDIISLDMRPFMPLMEGIIIRNTGGFDSVSTHCMFIQCDGMLNTSSLKTANHMTMNVDDAVSPIYRAEKLETCDTRLKEIQNLLDGSSELGDALWDFCFETDGHRKGLTYETIRQGLVNLKVETDCKEYKGAMKS